MLGLADTSTLSRWEHGVVIPSMVHVFQLARLYRIQPHDLYDELWQHVEKEFGLLAQNDELFNTNHSFYL